jgi:hypothetical protein
MGVVNRGNVRDVNWKDFTDFDVNAYMNPYTQNVVDTTTADIRRTGDIEQAQRSAQLAKAGAFGGSRQSVLDALAGGETARAVGDASAKLRSEAFDKATGLIHGDQLGGFNAQTSNQGADLGVEQINAQMADAAAGRADAMARFNMSQGSNAEALRLQALQSALSGGINLGSLDVSRGGALGSLGGGILGGLTSLGETEQNRLREDSMNPFQMQTVVASMLGQLPTNRTTASSGIQDTQGTQSYFKPDNTGAYVGGAATIGAAAIMM